jgi:hypothetical protein
LSCATISAAGYCWKERKRRGEERRGEERRGEEMRVY